MQNQTLQFAVTNKKDKIQTVKSAMFVPKTNFKGGSIKWYEDKPKQKEGK